MNIALNRRAVLATAVAAAFLSACGNGGDKGSTQVAAKVNKDEISVHQINFVLSRSGNVPAEQVKPASRQVLEKLIDQDLLVQKAVETKLDREPGVMQAVESSKRQLLAQAYLEKVTAAVTKPTPAEVSDYYAKHPELFSQRRIFRFQQVAFAGGKEVATQVQAQLGKSASLNDLVEWAKQNNLRYNASNAVKPAEQLPLELLPKLHLMKDGQIGMIAEGFGVSVIQLLASQEQPLDEKAASPVIEQFLVNKRKTELAEKEMKQLRSAASIEYMGDFAKKTEDGKTADKATAPVTAAQAPTATQTAESVKQGVAGLK